MIDMLPHEIEVSSPVKTTDRYGNETTDYEAGSTRRIDAFVQPQSTTEQNVDRNAVTYAFVVYTNDPLAANDRVLWDGRVHEVDGPSRRWDSPGLGPHHYETLLRVTEG